MKYIVVLLIIIIAGLSYYILETREVEDMDNTEIVEESGMDTEPVARGSIVGKWQSVDDPNFTRTIYENGGFEDEYKSEETITTNGSWVVVAEGSVPSDFPYEVEPNTEYLRLDDGTERFHFKVVDVTTDSLVLVYLDRGGVLTFTRIEM